MINESSQSNMDHEWSCFLYLKPKSGERNGFYSWVFSCDRNLGIRQCYLFPGSTSGIITHYELLGREQKGPTREMARSITKWAMMNTLMHFLQACPTAPTECHGARLPLQYLFAK